MSGPRRETLHAVRKRSDDVASSSVLEELSLLFLLIQLECTVSPYDLTSDFQTVYHFPKRRLRVQGKHAMHQQFKESIFVIF